MTYIDFINQCTSFSVDSVDFVIELENIIDNISKFDKTKVKKHLIKEYDNITSIAAGIDKCSNFVQQKMSKISIYSTNEKYIQFNNNLNVIRELIVQIINEKLEETDNNEENTTLLDSYIKKVGELSKQVGSLQDELKGKANNTSVDNKMFSVLLNGVSILGIFVAIAFSGFGSMSIFSNLNLDLENNFMQSIAVLSLVAFLVYNLILVLLYFIFKLNKLHVHLNDEDDEKNPRYVIAIWPFILIDIVGFAVVGFLIYQCVLLM